MFTLGYWSTCSVGSPSFSPTRPLPTWFHIAPWFFITPPPPNKWTVIIALWHCTVIIALWRSFTVDRWLACQRGMKYGEDLTPLVVPHASVSEAFPPSVDTIKSMSVLHPTQYNLLRLSDSWRGVSCHHSRWHSLYSDGHVRLVKRQIWTHRT